MLRIENIIIPGRHHVLTNFQHSYLQNLLHAEQVVDLNGNQLIIENTPNLIWAVTSANHKNTRRNPLPSNRREQAIEQFCTDLPANCFTYPINDLGNTARFADFTLKDIDVQSRGQFAFNPENTAILCSTPSVIEMYEKLGYHILPAELVDREHETFSHKRPWDLIEAMVQAGAAWATDATYENEVHVASRNMLEKYRLGALVIEVFNDPLLGDEGDITETRDYQTYRQAFEDGAERKYALISPYIKGGRIVDVGCATGSIIRLMSQDPNLIEADIYGIEASRKLYDICEQNRREGYFSNENVFFYQRNIMTGTIFPENSIDTTTTLSLTHEIESYLGRDTLLEFIKKIYEHTSLGGVYINSDVVGPDQKDMIVWMKLAEDDGIAESWDEITATPKVGREELAKLSTLGRFRRFARDFRAEEHHQIQFEEVTEADEFYIQLRLADACDFMSKKDYIDSWYSEMHETFCYWNFEDWKAALENVGFTVLPSSHAYRNEWLVENRYKNAVTLFTKDGDSLSPLDYPVTNLLIVAKKIS